MGDCKAVPELASPQEQVDVKQVILGAPHWFLLRRAAWGVLQELVVAVAGSVPVLFRVPVTDILFPLRQTLMVYMAAKRTFPALIQTSLLHNRSLQKCRAVERCGKHTGGGERTPLQIVI